MQQRNDTITMMKALAIICMVVGHSYTRSPIEGFVGLFHMPVFFFCSGYCFKVKYLDDFLSYMKRKIKTIWWPTFKWIATLVLLHNLLLAIGVLREENIGGLVVSYYGLKDIGKYLAMATLLHAHAPVFAGIWFVKMLLVASVVGFVVIKYCKGKIYYLVLGGMLVMSLLMLKFFPGHKPIVDQTHLPFLSSFFFLVGYSFKKENLFVRLGEVKMVMVLAIALLVCGYFCWLSSMVSLSVTSCLPFSLSALAGVILVHSLGKKLLAITPPYLLQYAKFLGNNTYAILMMHILSFKLVSVVIILFCGLEWSRLADFPMIHFMTEKGWWIAYLIGGINILLLGQIVYNKICCLWKK